MEEVIKKAQELSKKSVGWTQFRSCQAWTSVDLYDTMDNYVLIKSYNTIVGLVDRTNKKFYEIGKYSRTTSKQITQIFNSMFRGYDRQYIAGRV